MDETVENTWEILLSPKTHDTDTQDITKSSVRQ